jgi:uncharacterized RmlC-like cupin family protein
MRLNLLLGRYKLDVGPCSAAALELTTAMPQDIPKAKDRDAEPDWKNHGLRIIRSGELDSNTPQTPGMTRAEAISRARVGAQKLWAGTVMVQPNAKTGPHHHGELETVIYVVRGRARFRWGNNLEFVDEAGPGDFVYVPPYVPHQEMNARTDEPVEAVIVRSGQEPIVVNLDIPSPEDAADNDQPDGFHSAPKR